MKKILIVVLVMIVSVYMLPLATVGKNAEENPPQIDTPLPQNVNNALEVDGATFDMNTKISVCIDSEKVEMPLHNYLCGVVAAEMPASFPVEALKAQALAARTYTMYKVKLYESGMEIPAVHKGAQVCSDYAHCKAYLDIKTKAAELWGDKAKEYTDKITAAVSATDGIIATYGGEPIAAVFCAASSEKTERAADVWGGDLPYLQSVESPGGEDSQKYKGTVTITPEDFKAKFLKAHPTANFNDPIPTWFRDSKRSEAGGIIDVAVGGIRVNGKELRTMLGLNSTNFKFKPSEGLLSFETTGYGHGVGMSQYGARKLALDGKTYDEIIKWYYKGVELMIK